MSCGSGCVGYSVHVTLAAAASRSLQNREGRVQARGPVISLQEDNGGWSSQPLPTKRSPLGPRSSRLGLRGDARDEHRAHAWTQGVVPFFSASQTPSGPPPCFGNAQYILP